LFVKLKAKLLIKCLAVFVFFVSGVLKNKIMEAKFKLVPIGLDELFEKVKQAESKLIELKKIIEEISNCHVTLTLEQP
jgi:hypothetical protein